MSFRKLINPKVIFKPLITSGLETINYEKIKFYATYKAYSDKMKDYNDPSKYDYVKTEKFIPFFGWTETYEYKKKD